MDMYYLNDMHGLDHIHEHYRLNYLAKPLLHDVSTLNEDDWGNIVRGRKVKFSKQMQEKLYFL